MIRKWLGRRLLRRELEEARGDLAQRLAGATHFADSGETYAIGQIDGLRAGLDHVTQLATGRYPRGGPDPIAEAER